MWYYDTEKRECRRFMYRDCAAVGDNNNRFDTRPLCESMCAGRPLPLQPQPPSKIGDGAGGLQGSYSHHRSPKPAKQTAAPPTTTGEL
jgi:hypothetical protein